jgi:hypothetical protein
MVRPIRQIPRIDDAGRGDSLAVGAKLSVGIELEGPPEETLGTAKILGKRHHDEHVQRDTVSVTSTLTTMRVDSFAERAEHFASFLHLVVFLGEFHVHPSRATAGIF